MKIFRLLLISSLYFLSYYNTSFAQSLEGCNGIDQTIGPKVVLDKLEFKDESGKTEILTNEYTCQFLLELSSRLRNLFQETQPTPVICSNRDPKRDGSDFVTDLVKTLNNRNVLLEIWGTIKSSEENGEQALRANIFMMIIPVRYYDSRSRLDFHLLSYPKKSLQGDLESSIVKMAFGTEFDVYTSIAHGIKELKNDSYDKAIKYFSNARRLWEKAQANGILANSATNQNLVLSYIKELEQKTISDAASDPSYKGDLIAVMDIIQ